ncbi:MAG TPA: hypothetical protein VJX94_04300 [Stellaceae bacterium]|nr:hypothetical protein [Stellaceae bacterium]
MKNGIRIILLAGAAALIVSANGAARAEEASATLAVYVNGVLEYCVKGVAYLKDVPYREGTSDARTRMALSPAGSGGTGECPGSIPRKLPLSANVSAEEEESKSIWSEGERMTIRTFIFGGGKIESDTKGIGKQGY